MKLILTLIVIATLIICQPVPSTNIRLNPTPLSIDSAYIAEPWIRRIRSNAPIKEQSSSKDERKRNVFGYNIKVPSFVDAAVTRLKNFFVGPGGLVTKTKKFLMGNTTVSANFFGRKVDFQAHVPVSTEDAGKSVMSFFHKLKNDPMTRVLFAMYMNVVVIIAVFLILLAKHVHFSMHSVEKSRTKKRLASPTTRSQCGTPATPVLADSELNPACLSPSSEDGTHVTAEDAKTIDWSAVANPSLINYVNQDTIASTRKPRLLNDLEGLLSDSTHQSTDGLDEVDEVATNVPSMESKQMPDHVSEIKDSRYYTDVISALESTQSTFDEARSQYLPHMNDTKKF